MQRSSPLIVLTGPSTEMSDYEGSLITPFAAGFSKPWFIPRFFLKKTFFIPVPSNSLEVTKAPLGLRRLEASLVKSGFKPQDIAIVHPDNLEKAVGSDTKVIGIGAKDPFGFAYVSLTYSSVFDLGEPINKTEYKRLMKSVKRAQQKSGAKIIVGGPGSWQFLRPEVNNTFKVDAVFTGEGDVTAPEVFWKLSKGQTLPKVIEGKTVDINDIPTIIKPTIYGAVEISRGCGRGCGFCSPTMVRRKEMPVERVIHEVELNISYGVRDVLLVTEDIFMYGAKGADFVPNSEAVNRLLKAVGSIKEVESVQVTHANLAPVHADKTLARQVAEALKEKSKWKFRSKQVAAVEVGIESGSPRLIEKYMAGKCKPFKPDEWPDIVLSSLSFMEDHGCVALATILMGLPGETLEDTQHTIKLIQNIDNVGLNTFLVPLIFVPLGTCSLRNSALKFFNDLSETQVEVFASAWEHNIRLWGPSFFNHPPYTSKWGKLVFKLLGDLLYNLKYRRGDKGRKIIARRTLDGISQAMQKERESPPSS